MDGFIQFTLGSSFLLNAGIAGFVRFLQHNDAALHGDYEIKGQSLYVAKDYFNNDIAKMYVDTVADLLGERTKLYSLIDTVPKLRSIVSDASKSEAEKTKIAADIFKIDKSYFEKKSFETGLRLIESKSGSSIISNKITAFLKEKNLAEKVKIVSEIADQLKPKDIYNELSVRDLISYDFQIFFAGNPMTNIMTAFNDIKDKSISEFYKQRYIDALLNEFLQLEKKSKSLRRCIECSEFTSADIAISFMLDTADDLGKKKSYYWNCNPDAYVCGKCAFIYTFVPLGFAFLGQDTVFINNNSSVQALVRIMNTYNVKNDQLKSEITGRSKFYKSFITLKSEMLNEKINNIQVVVKSKDDSHFQLNILDKDMLQKLSVSAEYLQRLEKIYVKDGDSYIRIYNEVFNNIFASRNQYALINRLIKHHLSDNSSTYYIKNILDIQMIFKGGNNLESLKKNVDNAYMRGKEMREKLADDSKNADVDNSIRGFVYKLSNAVAVGNLEQYIDSIIRVYSGKGLPIPFIFKECYGSDEMFKAIGQAYILGLKSEKYVKDEKESKQ